MSSVNKIILLGRVGKDPETRTFDGGRKCTTFSIATSEKYKNKAGEKVEDTTWHNIVLWSPLAEIAEQYLKKGDQVYIEGKLTTRSWESNGETKYITEIVGRELTLLGGKQDQTTASPTTAASADSTPADDLPFIITLPLIFLSAFIVQLALTF